MNIDKQLLKVLQANAWTKIPYESLLETNPQQIRIEENNLMKEEGVLEVPDTIEVFNRKIECVGKSESLSLRIYKPKVADNLPVVLFFHGGAFIFGSPDQYDFQMYPLVEEANVIIVSVDYRLAPEYPYPAALEDAVLALQWVSKEAQSIGGNSDNITLMGSSAGGAIALSLLHLNRDLYHIPIRGAFVMYPPTSDKLNTLSMKTYANAPMQTYKSARYMWKHYLSRTSDKWTEYAVPNQMIDFWLLPKITLILAECDPLIDEAKQYADLVLARGGEVDIWEIKGAVHTFDFFDCELTTNFTREKIAYFKKLHLM